MAYLTVDEFKHTLINSSLDSIVKRHIFQGVPYVFRETPESSSLLIQHVCEAFRLPEENVFVVGSARSGFSLNPENFPRMFSDTSDIDVVVISEELFDNVWMKILEWHYPRRLQNLGHDEGNWARLRRKEIYWGWLVPSEIHYEGLSFPDILKPLRDISVTWFNAFQSLSLYPVFAPRTVSGRLYRTFDHALYYHIEGLRLIREKIQASEQGA